MAKSKQTLSTHLEHVAISLHCVISSHPLVTGRGGVDQLAGHTVRRESGADR
jgi:hypothetical protein